MDDCLGQVSGHLEVEMPNFTQLCSLTQAVTHTASDLRKPPQCGLGGFSLNASELPFLFNDSRLKEARFSKWRASRSRMFYLLL